MSDFPITFTRDFSVLSEAVDASQPLFCDTETQGLYGKIRIIQCYQSHWDGVIIIEYPKAHELLTLLTSVQTVWHNAHYDLSCVQNALDMAYPFTEFADTFLLYRLAHPALESYSFDDVCTHVLGYDPYIAAGFDKKVMQKSDWSKPVLDDGQKLYAALDVYHMPAIFEACSGSLDDPSYILDKSTVVTALKFQHNGMPVDPSKLDKHWVAIEKELASIDMPVNANSVPQVRQYLHLEEGQSTAKLELSRMAYKHNNEKAEAVIKVRGLRKLLSFLKKYDVERLKGYFKPSTRSGRLASDHENLQQIPRKLKGIFGYAIDSDRVLVYSDYAQLELRTICAILGVKVMERLFREGKDLHGYVAEILFGSDYTKADRQVTKTYNFNLLYGGSVNMVLGILLTYGTYISEVVANRHKRKWLNLFSEIDAWQQKSISAWRKGKLDSTPLGRHYKGKLMTDQMNIKNQGAGAEVAKLALHYFYPWLEEFNKEHDTDVMLCDFIHDSYILDAPNDPEIYKPVATKLAECMQEAWFEMSKLYKVRDLPMPVEVKVGWNWGDIEEGEGIIYEHNLEGMEMYDSSL